jgi:nitroreductase
MNVTDTILARRSVRSYRPQPVETALVHSLLESAVHAPSAMNSQPWLFAVVQDAARLKRWSDMAKQRLLQASKDDPEFGRYASVLRDESFNIFYDAGTLIVIGSAQHSRFSQADCWLATENLLLSARAAGLGTCCIGFALDLLNSAELKAELQMPDEAEIASAIVLGYAREFPPPIVRAAPKVTAWLLDGETKVPHGKSDERYAREHPAGFLASRAAPPVGERAGHPLVHDDPGFGAFGQRRLVEGERELSLAAPLPEALVSRSRPSKE